MQNSVFTVDRNSNLFSLVLLVLFWLLFFEGGFAQNATNYVSVDSLKVGDTFDYSIVLRTNQTYDQVAFPDSSHFGSPISIVNRKRYKVNQDTDSLSYTLQFFGTENYTIPKLPVRLMSENDTTTLYVPPVPLDFKTTLKSENESLLPLKPIFAFARNWWPYIIGLLILALAGYLSYWGYQKWKAAKETAPEPVFTPRPFTDPLQELKENLHQIRENSELRQHRNFKAFYSELGDVIRWYLERVYRIPALESTTRELIRDLHHKAAPEAMINKTESILKDADMVKFARFNPTLDQAFNSLEEGEEFLELARRWDHERIEYLRDQHHQRQQQMKERFNTEEETEVIAYD